MTTLYTQAELKKKSKGDLEELAAEHDLELDDVVTKATLIEALLELPAPEDDDELDDDEVDDINSDMLIAPADDEEEDDELELPDPDEEEADEVVEEKPKRKPKAAKEKPAATNGEETLAAKQVATILGTEAKTLRQFLRSDASTFEAVGSGGRYEFTKGDVDNIKKEFDAWKSAHASRGSKRGPNKKTDAPKADEIVEVEEIEELEVEELDDSELDDLELDD